jgi:serine/threonine protein kinase/WD40 repeat protein
MSEPPATPSIPAHLPSVSALVEAIARLGLIEPERLRQLSQELAGQPLDAHQLGRDLMKRGLLTAFQVNHLLQGHEQPLVVGPYQLLARLGEGGMGQVFKARHSRLGRVVALKLISPQHLGDHDAARRFRREVRSLSRLDHPNIVRAIDADEDDGRLYLVMELVEGTDLSRRVKEKGALPIGLACDCIRQAALALQHASEQGMVHRDIKPSNLLLGADGTIKVLDLGLARRGEADTGDSSSSTSLTDTGMTVGTPDYVAPEQITDSKCPDIRADLYSLGCTFYHLLTGRPPFAGGTLGLKLLRHQTEEPEPIAALRPEVPAALVAVVQKLMAKKPEERYQSPAEVAAVLDHLLRTGKWAGGAFAGLGDWTATPVSWLRRAQPSWQGRRLLAALAVAVLLFSSAALAVWLWPRPRPAPSGPAREQHVRPAPSSLEELAFEKIPDQERLGTGLLEETVQVLGSHQGMHGSLVWCLAFHPDGRRAFSIGGEGVIRVWDTDTMRQQAALTLGNTVQALAVIREPGGEPVLCVRDRSGGVTRWDAQTLKSLGRSVSAKIVQSSCFSPDGRYGLSAYAGQHARLFDLRRETELKRFPDTLPADREGGGTFTADGKRALVAVKKGQFSLLETATGKELWRFHGARGLVTRLAMTPDYKHVLSVDEAGHAWLWEVATNRVVHRFVPEKGNGFCDLALSADGRFAVLLCVLGNLKVCDLLDPRHQLRSVGQPDIGNPAYVLALRSDGRRALTGGAYGRLRLWDLERGKELCPCPDNVAEARCVALSPNGRLALSGHASRATLHDVVSGQVVHTIPEKGVWIQSVAFSPDGRRFAYGSMHGGKVHLCRTDTAEVLWSQPAHSGCVRALVFSGDGSRLYSGGGNESLPTPSLEEGTIRVWNTATGQPAGTLPGHTTAVRCLALSPDGTRLLSGAGDNKNRRDFTVRLWDLDSSKVLKRFAGHTAALTGVAFAPDGERAVSVSLHQTILWDLEAPPDKAGRPLRTSGYAVAFVSKRQVVEAGRTNCFHVCDLEGGTVSNRPVPHLVNGLALTKDGRYLATANSNGTVYILRLPLRGR